MMFGSGPLAILLLVTLLSVTVSGGGPLVKVGVYGFESASSQRELLRRLNSKADGLSGNVATLVESYALHSLDSDGASSPPSDVAIVRVHLTAIRYNEERVLLSLTRALKTLLQAEDKRTLVLLLEGGSDAQLIEARQPLGKLVQEAWICLDKPSFKSEDVGKECSIRLITELELAKDPSLLSGLLDGIFTEVSVSATEDRTLERLFPASSGAARVQQQPTQQLQLAGYEAVMAAEAAALLEARKAAQASQAKLQRLDAAPSFAVFCDNLVNHALSILNESCAKSNVPSSSAILITQAQEEVKRQIFAMLVPFYKRQVQLARIEVAKVFNEAVGEDLEVTVHLLDDLHAAKQSALKSYREKCAALLPKNAPKGTWRADWDVQQLEESLDEYNAGREAQARLVGVLSRGRKPIDVSFHYLALHPLGRDYRQDPLGMGRDKIVYDPALATAEPRSVSALQARSLLSQKQREESPSFFEARKLAKDSEFAREMLMLPLSIKNPGVPLMAGRGKKRSSVAAAKVDPERVSLGPERFIRWDLPQLQEAREALEERLRAGGMKESSEPTTKTSTKDKVVGALKGPLGFYKHPPVNYGQRLQAYKAPPAPRESEEREKV